jgi:hypothetical protein
MATRGRGGSKTKGQRKSNQQKEGCVLSASGKSSIIIDNTGKGQDTLGARYCSMPIPITGSCGWPLQPCMSARMYRIGSYRNRQYTPNHTSTRQRIKLAVLWGRLTSILLRLAVVHSLFPSCLLLLSSLLTHHATPLPLLQWLRRTILHARVKHALSMRKHLFRSETMCWTSCVRRSRSEFVLKV